jgi:hypothetical protein
VQLGITDVEPGAFILDNYPSAYKSSVYGKATSAKLAGLSATTLFDQVFGIFVNTNSSAFTAAEKAGQGTINGTLNLPNQTVTNALQGNITDWSKAPDTNGNAVTASSLPINVINREQGSGSRAATSIYWTDDECNKAATSIVETTAGTADYFSTGNVLAAANVVPGAITYAAVDGSTTSYANLTLVQINGITPLNLVAASGEYTDWFEATANTGANFSSLSGAQQGLINFLIAQWQAEATVPSLNDSLAIPGNSTNVASLPVSGTAVNNGKTIYINPFTRSGISCNSPLSFL